MKCERLITAVLAVTMFPILAVWLVFDIIKNALEWDEWHRKEDKKNEQ